MFGFLNVYKPAGKTSHDIVAILRKVTKIKQIGHTGTLDPFAEGVLPVAIGKAARLIEYLDDDKAYDAVVQFGSSTTTYDIEGEVLNTSDKVPDLEEIKTELKNFYGEIEQIPPVYSAIKINGKKLYEYARNGENIEVAPRKVNIKELNIINYNAPKRILNIHIECSKGTYIRSIANDLGEALGAYGHLIKLIRTKAGRFDIDSSVKLEEINSAEDVKNRLISPLDVLNYPAYELSENEKSKVRCGMGFHVCLPDGLVLLTCENTLAAVANVQQNELKCLKVFL